MKITHTGTLTLDIETHERDLLYSMPPEEFVRLIGYAWNDDEPEVTTDLEFIKSEMLKARWIIVHNGHEFDMRGIWGLDSNVPMQLADEGRIYDTFTHAGLVHPAPEQYTNRFGKGALAKSPEQALAWFALDEQAYQLGVRGKTADLSELALEFADQTIKNKKARAKDGFGKIPVDDERFEHYLKGDVRATRAVAKKLLELGPLDAYAKREQRIASRLAAIESAGWRVDVAKATARRDELEAKKQDTMDWLVHEFDFPTEGKQPWRSAKGKEAIVKALANAGVTEGSRPGWKRTQGGDLSLGGEVLLDITAGTEAEELGKRLAELMGQRSLSQLTLDSLFPDGRVHPEITALQRSGRTSTTKPGLTVWTSRGPGAVEKDYYIADCDEEALLEIDLSNADARVVAWYSGDKKFAERFEPGADGHLINAWAAWGKDVVGTDKHDPVTADYRYRAKKLGHGWNYGGQANTLSKQSGVPLEDAKVFVKGMNDTYWKIVQWQEAVRSFARQHGYVMNMWGRKMFVEKGREFTQAPALLGQSGTREVMMDALLAMPHNVVRKVKAIVHDAFVFSVPKARFDECRTYLKGLMEAKLEAPPGGMPMEFPAEAGPMGDTWYTCAHD